MPSLTDERRCTVLTVLAVLWSAFVFLFQFLVEGGHQLISPDGRLYLAAANGEAVGRPFSTRLLQPLLASLIGRAGGIPTADVFRFLTFAESLAALYLLGRVLSRRTTSPGWVGAVLFGLGTAVGAEFGHAPIVTDALLLLMSCLTVVALDTQRWLLALLAACLGALTKEYGVLLGILWGIDAHRHLRSRSLAVAGSLAPAFLLGLLSLRESPGISGGIVSFLAFIKGSLAYEVQYCLAGGGLTCVKMLYIWSWAVLWPLFFIATVRVIRGLISRTGLGQDDLRFGIVLPALPLLLVGDWDRSLLILVPTAFAAATGAAFAGDRRLQTLLWAGSVSTALANPLYTEVALPATLRLTLLSVSGASTIGFIGWFLGRARRPK